MGYLEQEARFAAITLAILLFASSASASSFQEKTPPAKDTTRDGSAGQKGSATQQTNAAPEKPKNSAAADKAKDPAVVAKAKPQKRPPWRVLVISDVPIPSVSVHAKKAQLSDVTAEIGRQLNIPVVLSAQLKQQQLTTDFENFTVEAAARLLAPRAIIDYVVTGGNGPLPSKKEPLAIYLMNYDENPPREGPFVLNKSGAQMLVGMLYATEDEEKVALEEKARDLQVSLKDDLFSLKVHKQYLTDVLETVAVKAKIPFAILTNDRGQKELEEVVTWSIDKVSLEDLTKTWFPNGIRLYWRTDLESYVSKPLRLTIEPMDKTQVERIITP